ncbi:uncharacterized protein LOC143257572 isoform X2 [Tachypleus tridentatus]
MTNSENSTGNFSSFQQFLDRQQYSRNGVKRYEWIFGKTFLSTGGKSLLQNIVGQLKLKPGEKVLDVGTGLGGHDFYMAETFGVTIHGVDLSVNMMKIALEYLAERPAITSQIHFEICDVTVAEFEAESFDAVYSRDTFIHLEKKEALFKHFFKWLKPGGRILFSDYCIGNDEPSEEFKTYVASRKYHLWTVSEYEKLLQKVGFMKVKAEDRTQDFRASLQRELKKLQDGKAEFLSEFCQQDYDDLYQGWSAKIHWVDIGDQKWGLCYAEKPMQ